MKRFMNLGVLAVISLALFLFASCEPKTDPIIAVDGVSICDANGKALETITLEVGEEITLTAKITPSDATNKTVKWSSSDDKIAKVDANGKVTGVGAGNAKVTATTEDGSFTATVEANVKTAEDRITASITPTTQNDVGEITIAIDENVTLTAPKGFEKYTWFIDDVKVKEAEESVKKTKELKLVVDKETKKITVDGTSNEVEEGQHLIMLIVNDELSATYYLEIKKQQTGGNL